MSLNDGRPFWGSRGTVAGHWTCEEGSDETPLGSGKPTVVSMNGHPSYVLSRHPLHGGVILQSCWCVLSGFPMANRGYDPFMEDDALDLSTDDPRQAAEVARYNNQGY